MAPSTASAFAPDNTEIDYGVTLNFGAAIFTGDSYGEYAGYEVTGFDSLIFDLGDVNAGQTFTATDGTDTITFTVGDIIVADLSNNGSTTAWQIAGTLEADGVSDLSLEASFSFAGTSSTSSGYTFHIQTPSEFATTVPVPLPASLPLMGAALAGLAVLRRRG